MDNICWSVSGDEFDAESLQDLFDNYELKDGDVVYYGEAVKPTIKQLIDANDICDMLTDRAWDLVGEYAEDFPNVSKEAIAELDSLLQSWLTQHCPINFYQVINTREYVITATDIKDYVDNS